MITKQKTFKNYDYKTSLIKFKWLYSIKSLRSKILIAMLLGVIYSLATTIFVKNTSLYTGGTSAFFFGIARLVQTYLDTKGVDEQTVSIVYNGLFWGLYLMMNIPLFFLAYKKVGKNFAIISMSFLVVNQVYGFFWGMIPGLRLNIFGTTENVNEFFSTHYGIDVISFGMNIHPGNDVTADWIYHPNTWVPDSMVTDDNSRYSALLINSNFSKTISLFFYACFFSIISAYVVCVLFILGGSSAGSDFITIWYSVKKHKDVGKIYTIINTSFLFTGVLLGSYISGIIAWNDVANKYPELSAKFTSNPMTNIMYLLSANLFCSLIWVYLNGVIIEKIFPSKKLVKCELTSIKIKEIDKKIFNSEKYKVYPIKRYRTDNSSTLKFLCTYLEFTYVYRDIKLLDDKAFIISSYAHDVDGPLDLYSNNFAD